MVISDKNREYRKSRKSVRIFHEFQDNARLLDFHKTIKGDNSDYKYCLWIDWWSELKRKLQDPEMFIIDFQKRLIQEQPQQAFQNIRRLFGAYVHFSFPLLAPALQINPVMPNFLFQELSAQITSYHRETDAERKWLTYQYIISICNLCNAMRMNKPESFSTQLTQLDSAKKQQANTLINPNAAGQHLPDGNIPFAEVILYVYNKICDWEENHETEKERKPYFDEICVSIAAEFNRIKDDVDFLLRYLSAPKDSLMDVFLNDQNHLAIGPWVNHDGLSPKSPGPGSCAPIYTELDPTDKSYKIKHRKLGAEEHSCDFYISILGTRQVGKTWFLFASTQVNEIDHFEVSVETAIPILETQKAHWENPDNPTADPDALRTATFQFEAVSTVRDHCRIKSFDIPGEALIENTPLRETLCNYLKYAHPYALIVMIDNHTTPDDIQQFYTPLIDDLSASCDKKTPIYLVVNKCDELNLQSEDKNIFNCRVKIQETGTHFFSIRDYDRSMFKTWEDVKAIFNHQRTGYASGFFHTQVNRDLERFQSFIQALIRRGRTNISLVYTCSKRSDPEQHESIKALWTDLRDYISLTTKESRRKYLQKNFIDDLEADFRSASHLSESMDGIHAIMKQLSDIRAFSEYYKNEILNVPAGGEPPGFVAEYLNNLDAHLAAGMRHPITYLFACGRNLIAENYDSEDPVALRAQLERYQDFYSQFYNHFLASYQELAADLKEKLSCHFNEILKYLGLPENIENIPGYSALLPVDKTQLQDEILSFLNPSPNPSPPDANQKIRYFPNDPTHWHLRGLPDGRRREILQEIQNYYQYLNNQDAGENPEELLSVQARNILNDPVIKRHYYKYHTNKYNTKIGILRTGCFYKDEAVPLNYQLPGIEDEDIAVETIMNFKWCVPKYRWLFNTRENLDRYDIYKLAFLNDINHHKLEECDALLITHIKTIHEFYSRLVTFSEMLKNTIASMKACFLTNVIRLFCINVGNPFEQPIQSASELINSSRIPMCLGLIPIRLPQLDPIKKRCLALNFTQIPNRTIPDIQRVHIIAKLLHWAYIELNNLHLNKLPEDNFQPGLTLPQPPGPIDDYTKNMRELLLRERGIYLDNTKWFTDAEIRVIKDICSLPGWPRDSGQFVYHVVPFDERLPRYIEAWENLRSLFQ